MKFKVIFGLVLAACASSAPQRTVHIILGVGNVCCTRLEKLGSKGLSCQAPNGNVFVLENASNYISTNESCGE